MINLGIYFLKHKHTEVHHEIACVVLHVYRFSLKYLPVFHFKFDKDTLECWYRKFSGEF